MVDGSPSRDRDGGGALDEVDFRTLFPDVPIYANETAFWRFIEAYPWPRWVKRAHTRFRYTLCEEKIWVADVENFSICHLELMGRELDWHTFSDQQRFESVCAHLPEFIMEEAL